MDLKWPSVRSFGRIFSGNLTARRARSIWTGSGSIWAIRNIVLFRMFRKTCKNENFDTEIRTTSFNKKNSSHGHCIAPRDHGTPGDHGDHRESWFGAPDGNHYHSAPGARGTPVTSVTREGELRRSTGDLRPPGSRGIFSNIRSTLGRV